MPPPSTAMPGKEAKAMIYGGKDKSFADLAGIVNRSVERLRPHAGEFDSIAVRGVSGLAVGSPVALALGKALVVVRKPDEVAHTGLHQGMCDTGARWLFLDDFISSGATHHKVIDAIAEYHEARNMPVPEEAGVYLYEFDQLTIYERQGHV